MLGRRRFRPIADAIAGTHANSQCKVHIVHASENIEMHDSIRMIRGKPNASINIGCRLAGESWKAWKKNPSEQPAAFISSGHSGAVMASALLNMGRLPQIERPAIAVTLPTLQPRGCVFLDVGANVDCKPEHLRDFALMGALYAQAGETNAVPASLPRVGVLSNGEERSKGNELTRSTLDLLEKHPGFGPGPKAFGKLLGYSEGKEIFKGQVDVVVTDGFVGNVVLKSLEGLGSSIVTILKNEARSNPLNRLKKKLDYAEYGAAPLLGVAGYAFICHGRSNGAAIKNALLRSQSALQSKFMERLSLALEGSPS
jgi:glycerol-3-phosphate acyltransferase PlsX